MKISNECLQYYSKIIAQYSLLDKKEEMRLYKIISGFKTGIQRQKAREKFFLCNLRLVVKRALFFSNKLTFSSTSLSLEDLIESGIEGLGIAIDRFNPSKFKTKFSTFSIPWIDLKIRKTIVAAHSDVFIPQHIREKNKAFKDLTDDGVLKMSEKEAAKLLNVSLTVLKSLQAANESKVFSLDSNCYKNDNHFTFKDVIADNKTKSPDICCHEKENKHYLRRYLGQLDPMSKDILYCRYINDDQEGLDTIGKRYGLTGERIRQIEVSALKKLKKKIKSKSFFGI